MSEEGGVPPVNVLEGLLLGLPHDAELDCITFHLHSWNPSTECCFLKLDDSAFCLLPVQLFRVLIDVSIDVERTI